MHDFHSWADARPERIALTLGDSGEQPMAVVVLRQGHAPSAETARAIVAEAAGGLSRIKRPQRLQFVDELPRLPTGKLLRRVLKDRLRDQPQAGFSLR